MALISQIVSASYNAVMNNRNKPENQWEESAFMKFAKKKGFIKTISGGPQIEKTLDYRQNPGAGFHSNDLDPLAMGKTEVLTSALYDWSNYSVPVVWSKADDVKNSEQNQKVDFVDGLLTNADKTHDAQFETALFTTSTQGFLGLQTQVPDSGQGSVGGVSAVTETWWRNPVGTYLAAGTDIVSKLTVLWNAIAKGTGSAINPSLLVSDGATQAIYEATQVGLQRYESSQELKVGFTSLAFKTANYIFSQYGGSRIYMLTPDAIELVFAKGASKTKGSTDEINNGQGYRFFMFTMAQLVVANKSRLGLLTQV